MINRERLAYLVKSAVERTASQDELQELIDMLKNDTGEIAVETETLLKENKITERKELSAASINTMATAVLRLDGGVEKPVIKVINLWKKVAAAASIMVMLGAGSYFLIFNNPKQNIIAETIITEPQDILAPQNIRAKITLSDSTTVTIDSVSTGMLATQGNVNIIKTSKGGIAYQSTVDSRQSKIAYNTVYNSRGSNILSLTLNDGTRLWLNSESSVRFPVAFIGNERKVIVTGEVYFEVVKSSKKFLVDANGTLTEVLGTHFNINAYRDKALVKITLLEGRVKVTSSNNQSAIIRPLQQVEVENSSTIRVIGGINPEEVMAWKNGSFQYKDADIEFIMKDLMRWYDIEVAYEGVKPAGHYAGVISRNTNLSEVLKMLEMSGVKTKIKDRKIIVMQ